MNVLEIRIGGRYKLKQSIGQGTFGEIYIGKTLFIWHRSSFFQLKMSKHSKKLL